MAFVQLMEYQTSDPEAIERLHEEWKSASQGTRHAKRMLLTRHHGDGNRFCELVFFDSYDEAMENSKLPETQEFSERLRGAVDGEVSYFDLDVVDEQAL